MLKLYWIYFARDIFFFFSFFFLSSNKTIILHFFFSGNFTHKFDHAPDAPEDVVVYYNYWRAAVRLRILNVLKKWIEHNFYEVRENEEILKDFEDFVENVVATNQTGKWGELLIHQFRNAKDGVINFFIP